MAKNQKKVPLTPDEVLALTTMQLLRRAQNISAYWQQRSDAILKLASPTAGQLESQPWYEQHALIFGLLAEKLGRLEELEQQERQRHYDPR